MVSLPPCDGGVAVANSVLADNENRHLTSNGKFEHSAVRFLNNNKKNNPTKITHKGMSSQIQL